MLLISRIFQRENFLRDRAGGCTRILSSSKAKTLKTSLEDSSLSEVQLLC